MSKDIRYVGFARRLDSVMQDNRYDRYVGGLRSGKLDTKRLYKIGRSQKLFKKKQERLHKEYDVSILVDVSGSMHGYKAEQAAKAVTMLSKGFHHAKIPFEIVAFNSFDFPLKGFDTDYDEKYVSNMIQFLCGSSIRGHDVPEGVQHWLWFKMNGSTVIPPWDLKPGDVTGYGSGAPCAGWNVDGKAVYEMAQRLKEKKGEKIAIVLSDGQPETGMLNDKTCHDRPQNTYGDYHLKDQVLAAINDGITFIGVGIESSAVEEYYPKENVVVLRDLDDLYPAIIGKFNKFLKRG